MPVCSPATDSQTQAQLRRRFPPCVTWLMTVQPSFIEVARGFPILRGFDFSNPNSELLSHGRLFSLLCEIFFANLKIIGTIAKPKVEFFPNRG